MTDYNIKSVILNPNKNGIGKVYLEVSFYTKTKRQRIYFPTSITTAKEKFVNGTSTIKEIHKLIQNEIVNLYNEINTLRLKGIVISFNSLQDFKESQKAKSNTLIHYINETIKYKLDNQKSSNICNYETLVTNLKEFQAKTKKEYCLTDIHQKFINAFIMFLRGKNLRSTTIRINYISMLKSVLNHLYKNKIIDSSYKELDYSIKIVESDLLVLNQYEIQQLIKYIPSNKVEKKIKDLALIQLMTSLRFSDLNKITKDNFSNNSLIIRLDKTDVFISIPLMESIVPLFEKYEYNLKKNLNYHTSNFNKRLKKIFAGAEINRNVEVVTEVNGLVISSFKPICEVIGSHSLRRSAITLFDGYGLSIAEIQSITGHKDIRSVIRYIKVSDTVKAAKMSLYNQTFKIA